MSAMILFLALLLVHMLVLPAGAVTIRVPADSPTIQGAINATTNGDTVLVGPGTYFENINFLGKAITVKSDQGPEVTVIDGNRNGSVVTFSTAEGRASVLDGFTLQNGSSGGVTVSGASPTIVRNLVIHNTFCEGLAGGIEVSFGSPLIQGNVVAQNSKTCSWGGYVAGILIGGASAAEILDNIISRNSAPGAAIELFAAGSATIRGNVIDGNTGGGILMSNDNSGAVIVQNLITNNGWAGISWSSQPDKVVNNTIADNNVYQVVIDASGPRPQVINNIIVGKSGQIAVSCDPYIPLTPPTFRFNDVFAPSGTAYGGGCADQTGTNGNISADPLFIDRLNGVYYLTPSSPAIDAGDNLAPDLPLTDLDGDPRIVDGDEDGLAVVDLGTFESVSSPGIIMFGSSVFTALEASGSAQISVIRKGGTDGQVTVDYTTSNGTALADLDYAATSGTLTFLNGDSVKNFSVPLITDNLEEGLETVNLQLSNVTGGATLGARSDAVLEISDAGSIQFSASSYNVPENGGYATITITRTEGSAGAITALFTTSDSTATGGSDYYPVSQVVTFGDGDSTSKTVQVSIRDDTLYEGNETVNLALSNPTGGVVVGSPSIAVLTIVDNDQPPPPAVQMTPYFPIDSGDAWTYQVDGESFTRTVLQDTFTINGLNTKALADGSGFVQYFSNDSAGVRLHRQFQPNTDIGLGFPVDLEVTFSPPVVLAKATMSVGQTVTSGGTAQTNNLPQVGVLRFGYSASFTLQGFETATVPAGTFDALKLQGSVNIAGDVVYETIYLVEYIGAVKIIDTNEGITETAEAVAIAVKNDWHIAATADFDGDGKSDILWRHDYGTVAIRLMNSATAVLGTVGNDWQIAGSGDFNGDGKGDILWRNDSGVVGIWLMNGSTVQSTAVLGTVGNDWQIAGSGDFNGDGKGDILWRHDSGAVAMWLMNGFTMQSAAVLGTVGNDWQIAGSGDFNGDGKSDILWRSDSGVVGIWQMSGLAVQSVAVLGTVGSDWHITGTGDFNGDGTSGILWRHDTGAVAIWQMNGLAVQSAAVLGTVGNDWQIAGNSDFDGDGKSDILWRHDSGVVGIWLMNGLTVQSTSVLGTVGKDLP